MSFPWPDDTEDQLKINGRNPEEFESADEQLFIRFSRVNWDEPTQKLNPTALPYAYCDQSCNRERFSSATQALFHKWPSFGVVGVPISSIPPPAQHPTESSIFELKPVHCPAEENIERDEKENFAHSEIRCFENGHFDRKTTKPPNRLGKQLRTDLFINHKVHRTPD